jgi:hypothetical protein
MMEGSDVSDSRSMTSVNSDGAFQLSGYCPGVALEILIKVKLVDEVTLPPARTDAIE